MDPEISIVIPTHNRCKTLLKTIASLCHQTIDPQKYEVIVLADGCHDGTVAAIRDLCTPFPLKLIELPDIGPAAARNRGARAVNSPFIMFLDDDIEVTYEVVSSHLEELKKSPNNVVVLGDYPLNDELANDDIFSCSIKVWWSKYFSNRSSPFHRFTFCDMLTGNVSLSRELFEDTGGFDESLSTYEDYDFGLNLIKRRVNFRVLNRGFGIHNSDFSVTSHIRRIRNQGRAHVLLLRKYSELSSAFPLGRGLCDRIRDSHKVSEKSFKILWKAPILIELTIKSLFPFLIITKSLKIRWIFNIILSHIVNYSYWLGVREQLSTIGQLNHLHYYLSPPELFQFDYNKLNVYLPISVSRINNLLNSRSIESIDIYSKENFIGNIKYEYGTQPIEVKHLYETLINRFGYNLLASENKALSPQLKKFGNEFFSEGFALAALMTFYKNKNLLKTDTFLFFGPGWYKENDSSRFSTYWMKSTSLLLICTNTSGFFNLGFRMHSFYPPMIIEFYNGDCILNSKRIYSNSSKNINVQIYLNEGINFITFYIISSSNSQFERLDLKIEESKLLSLKRDEIELEEISIKSYSNFAKGFLDIETSSGIPTRSMMKIAALLIYSIQSNTFDLKFQAISRHGKNAFDVYVDDEPVGSQIVPSDHFIDVSMKVNLSEGINNIWIIARERATDDQICFSIRKLIISESYDISLEELKEKEGFKPMILMDFD